MRSVLAGLVLFSSVAGAQGVVVDRLVALVDGKPIVRSAVQERAWPQLMKGVADDKRKELEAAAFTELVDEALIAHDADAMRIEVTPEEVDRAFNEIATTNQLTVAQLSVEVVKQGYTVSMYRQMLRQQLLQMRWVRSKMVDDANVKGDATKYNEYFESEKKRLLAALRARATIEVLP